MSLIKLHMKSIESKISNVLNPAKKEGDKVNRKQLATDDSGSCGTNVNYSLSFGTFCAIPLNIQNIIKLHNFNKNVE